MKVSRLVFEAVAVAFLVLAPAVTLQAQATDEWRSWNRPVEPFRIAANLWYVGASDITSYLITTGAGHAIVDGGFPETAPQILANVRKLGFEPGDVKLLLASHAHFDHAGGLAELARATGAIVVASAEEAPALERGGRDDFAWGDTLTFPPVTVGRRVADGETIPLGGVSIVAHLTPGHTRGCTSWSLALGEAEPRLHALLMCSVTAPGYRLVGNEKWPGIVEAYEATFGKLATLPCDVFLSNHGFVFDLEGKRRRAAMGLGVARGPAAGGPANPFVDRAGCRAYLEEAEKRFRAELAKQREESAQRP
ncbi:MAG: subclass B3 metallo-beta-lactamase [Thermoanaerobaculia bacterium]|nr:MAG: subclass B3 metallo-beta-lactamase [Thermoanaerobaculia bacterium]